MSDKNKSKENQPYDRIMRENLRQVFMPLIASTLNLKIRKVTPLPDKQPSTILRETDSFLLAETDSKTHPKLILHIEFESSDDANMIYRMTEYHGIELRKYKLPIKHFVVYLGSKKPKMRTELKKEEIFTKFELIDTNRLSAQEFLESNIPEVIILAILAGYQKENAATIIRAILTKLLQICETKSDTQKFYRQLTLLSKLRKLQELTNKIIKDMPITFDIKTDYIYQQGKQDAEKNLLVIIEQEREKAKQEREKAKQEREIELRKTIVNMLNANLDIEMIMSLLELPVERVNHFIKEIQTKEKD